jgi:hypothetical protein
MNLPSIPKIYTLGQRHNSGIFENLVQVEEKIDGSQFSFGIVGGKLECRSKGQAIALNEPGMFKLGVETAQHIAREIDLPEGVIFQCEFLAKPKHNILAYSRVPKLNLVLFDVRWSDGSYVNSDVRETWAHDLGIEAVKVFYQGYLRTTANIDSFIEYFERESQLGGVKIEGVVIKNYFKTHPEAMTSKAPMTAKIVAPAFKEKRAFIPKNPGKDGVKDIVDKLTNCLRTEARWLKAVQRMREAGKLANENSDIGPLCKEIQADILAEEGEWIKQKLFEEFSKDILKGTVHGFAQFYQRLLVEGPTVFQEVHQGIQPVTAAGAEKSEITNYE